MLPFKTKHFLTGEELSEQELFSLIEEAHSLQKNRNADTQRPLAGKTLALVFEKPSLRTRVSFTVGIQELGGRVFELNSTHRKTEDPEDTIRVLQGMVHGVMIRTFEHEILERMIPYSTIPIINGLSDLHHPCQALADVLTLRQRFERLQKLTLTYIGDGNNVLHSLLLIAPFLGVHVHYACPPGYQPDAEILRRAFERAAQGKAQIRSFSSPQEAAQGAHALYTDVWTSMGQESQDQDRLKAFSGYQINADLLAKADSECIIMHCLPMIKGQEITREMVEHPRSAIFQQAENRLHAQKALMIGLFAGQENTQTSQTEFSNVI